MGSTAVTQFKCDICGKTDLVPSGRVPREWVSFEIDGMIDREWIEKAICGYCMKQITEATEPSRKKYIEAMK